MHQADNTTLQNTSKQTNDPKTAFDVVGEVAIQPGEATHLTVGLFENSFPEPSLEVDVEPKAARILSSLTRKKDGSEYILTYQFRNLQDAPCLVTVRSFHAA